MRFKKYLVALITTLFSICVILIINNFFIKVPQKEAVKIGFVYISDQATAYTNNFCRSQLEIEDIFENKICNNNLPNII